MLFPVSEFCVGCEYLHMAHCCSSYAHVNALDGLCPASCEVNATQCRTGEEYEVLAVTPTNDRECQPLTLCGTKYYEGKAPTATSDRVCDAHTACGEDEFEVVAPSGTSDRECAACTLCLNGTAQVVSCGPASDAVCEPCTDEQECCKHSDCSVAEVCAVNFVCVPCRQCGTLTEPFDDSQCSEHCQSDQCRAHEFCDGAELYCDDRGYCNDCELCRFLDNSVDERCDCWPGSCEEHLDCDFASYCDKQSTCHTCNEWCVSILCILHCFCAVFLCCL